MVNITLTEEQKTFLYGLLDKEVVELSTIESDINKVYDALFSKGIDKHKCILEIFDALEERQNHLSNIMFKIRNMQPTEQYNKDSSVDDVSNLSNL